MNTATHPTTAKDAVAAYARWIAPRPSLVVLQPETFCNMKCIH